MMPQKYGLIPSQQNIYLLVKYSFHKQIVQIPSSFALNKDIDFDILTKAVNIEIERNDSLRLRFTEESDGIKQYFLDEFKFKSIPVMTFKTQEEQEEFFGKDAQKPVRFIKGEVPYRIIFFNAYNGYKGIYFNCSHLAVDAMGIMIFFYDLLGVYLALIGKGEMPAPLESYEKYVVEEFEKLKNTKRLEKGRAFFDEYFRKGGEPTYAAVHGPEFLEKERKKLRNPNLKVPYAYAPIYDKAEVVQYEIDPAESEKIFNYCKENNVAPESLFTFAMRTYCSAINYRTEDVFYNLMCSKRITAADKRTGGCMAQTLQVRNIIPETNTFKQGLDEIFQTRTTLYRYLSYPFVYARKQLTDMYNHQAIQGVAAFMFSWLPIPINEMKDFKVDFKTYNLGRYFNPLYAICYPDPRTGGIMMHYMYRCKIVTPQNVESFHSNMLKIIDMGIENPDIPISKLLDAVER